MSRSSLEILRQVAKLSNFLAKQLEGTDRGVAYEVKSKTLSTLLIEGFAWANGYCLDGIVGIDIGCDPSTQLHVPLNQLETAARAIVLKQLGGSR